MHRMMHPKAPSIIFFLCSVAATLNTVLILSTISCLSSSRAYSFPEAFKRGPAIAATLITLVHHLLSGLRIAHPSASDLRNTSTLEE